MSIQTSKQPRQPIGIPIAGEYTFRTKEAADLKLAKQRTLDTLVERRALFEGAGYVPPTVITAFNDPSSSSNRGEWWDRGFVAAEYATDGKSYAQMPDDNTPSNTRGRALSGNRRTHRMLYRNGDIQVRMPSATAIKRFSQDNGNPTFDVPVSVTLGDGSPAQGWVRVTKTGPHTWTTTTLGGGGESADKIAEAVASVLESRRPSTALVGVGDLLEKHKARQAAAGFEMKPVRSTFLDRVGYDDVTGVMATEINGKLYAHRTSKDVFEKLVASQRPGSVYNALVKKSDSAGAAQCEKCGRFYNATLAHTCPTTHKAPDGLGAEHTAQAKAVAERIAANGTTFARPEATPSPVVAAPVAEVEPPVQPAPVVQAPARAVAPTVATAPKARRPYPHLNNPIMNTNQYNAEYLDLRERAARSALRIRVNQANRQMEAYAISETYIAHVVVGIDGKVHRFVNQKEVVAFDPQLRKAAELERYARANALGLARITDAEMRRNQSTRNT